MVVLLLCREDEGRPMERLAAQSEMTSTRSTSTRSSVDVDAGRAPAAVTLSRSVLTLSRCNLHSSSSQRDVTWPLEVDVIDDADRGVSRIDRLRIEMFYRSHETEVYVCSSLADLFIGVLRPPTSGTALHYCTTRTKVI